MKLLFLLSLLGLASCAGAGGYNPFAARAGMDAGNAAMDAGNAAAAHQNNFFTPPPSGF